MNEETARSILGATIHEDGGLFDTGNYTHWSKNSEEITLDGRFTTDELEAMAWWMRNKGEGA